MTMNNEHQEVIRSTVEDLVTGMGFTATVEIAALPELTGYLCSVTVVGDQNFLIGQYGMNLAALQHLIRIIVRKKIGEKLDIIVDVNNYFSDKKKLLEKEAEEALQEVLKNNISVALRPMLSYERKVVHSFLAAHESVMTESVGSGEARKIMIRPRTATQDQA